MTTNNSADDVPIVARIALGDKFAAALRLYVGQGRRYSYADASRATGIKADAIKALCYGPDSVDWREPKLHVALSLAKFLGSEFASDWLLAADLIAVDAALPDGPDGVREFAADAVDDAAIVNRAAADDVFDHNERVPLRRVGLRMMQRGAKLARAA